MQSAKSYIFIILLAACTHTAQLAEEARALLMNEGGFTLHARHGNMARSGLYAVSAYPERTLELNHEPSTSEIQAFLAANQGLLEIPGNNLGGWCEARDAGKACFLDVTKLLPEREHAVRLGVACNQIAIAHLAQTNVEFITTGGTGTAPKEGTPTFKACQSLREGLP